MMQRNTDSTQLSSPNSDLNPAFRNAFTRGFAAAALLAASLGAHAQDAAPAQPAAQTAQPDTAAQPQNDISLSNQKASKTRKADKVIESKATKKVDKQAKKDNPLLGQDAKLPDKQLYDKAEDAIKRGRFDVGRLDLQTLLNTYPESQFMMRAKLAIADSWYKEGGTAALTQAEQEYKDFITFFPNAPEAAEAQMRVGDIYRRQMDKPDRDYTTTVHAEEEYRLMLQQFPDSPLVPQAQQYLREVQEVLAAREANIAQFYAQRQPPNYSGAIARFQTVADTYPLYSHMDDVLIGLGDAYSAEAHYWRTLSTAKLPEALRARLESTKAQMEKMDADAAQAAYTKVVLEHAAAPHVEDAKDRLVGMGLPVPTPTPEQLAASTALENSRGQYTLSKRAVYLFMHQADTVPAATTGTPSLEDAAPTSAAIISKKATTNYQTLMTGGTLNGPVSASTATPESAPAADQAAPAPAASSLSLQDVPTETTGGGSSSTVTNVPQSSPSTRGGTYSGIEIVQPGSGSQAPATSPTSPPAFPGTTATAVAAPAQSNPPAPAQPADANGGIKPVGPPNSTALPPVEKAATAPDPINDAAGTAQPPAAQTAADGKKTKVNCDKSDESCSKHKPKHGLAKLNPF